MKPDVLLRFTVAIAVGMVLSACGSTAADSTNENVAAEATGDAVPIASDVAPAATGQAKCEAWSSMMSRQPSGQFPDDAALSDAFSTFAGVVDEAKASFPPGQATVLQSYVEALAGYAADPASVEANATMADMMGPMSALTGEIVAECGPDVLNGF